MKRSAPLLALIWLLTACGGMTEGRVAEKGYEPPSGYYTMICSAYNTQGMCTVNVPMWVDVPECWWLQLTNAGETGSVCVDKQEWDNVKVGDRWEAR